MMHYIAYLVTGASIIGTIANSYQKRWCFYIWLCTNAFWCAYNAVNRQTAQALLYVFNFIMAVVGLIQWRTRKANARAKETGAGVPMKESDRREFARIVTHANAAEIIAITNEMESFVYSGMTEDDRQFCQSQMERRCKQLLEHYDKYQCFPD